MKRILVIIIPIGFFCSLQPMDKPTNPSQLNLDLLIRAAQNGMASAFEEFKRSGIDINIVHNGTTALHEACHSTKSVKALLALKANPDVVNKDGNTPLTKAIRSFVKEGHFWDGNHYIWKTKESSKLEKIAQLLLMAGATPQIKDTEYALAIGWPNMLKILLKHRAPIASKGQEFTVLSFAIEKWKRSCSECYGQIVPLLLQPNLIEAQNPDGETALFLTCTFTKTDMLKMLLKAGANVQIKNKNGETALVKAIKHSHANNIELFKKYQVLSSIINEKDNNGETPIFSACQKNVSTYILSFLLKEGANISVRNNKGQTILAKAIEAGTEAHVRILKSHGATLIVK